MINEQKECFHEDDFDMAVGASLAIDVSRFQKIRIYIGLEAGGTAAGSMLVYDYIMFSDAIAGRRATLLDTIGCPVVDNWTSGIEIDVSTLRDLELRKVAGGVGTMRIAIIGV